MCLNFDILELINIYYTNEELFFGVGILLYYIYIDKGYTPFLPAYFITP